MADQKKPATPVRVQENLADNSRRFDKIADLSPAGIFRTNVDGACIYMNPACLRMSGLTLDQAMGDGWKNAIAPEDRDMMKAAWNQAINDKAEFRHEFRFQRPDGHISWMDIIAGPEIDGDGRLIGYVGINLDISKSKALEMNLICARRNAEAAAEAKSRFLANMSHEIRTPMNGMIGFIQLLLDSELTTEQQQQAQMILDSGNAMMRLLNDILDISKVEAGQLRATKEAVCVADVLKSCIRLLRPTADQKGLKLHLDIADSVPENIVGDGHHLRQIVLNLLANAVKFTADGHVWLRAFAQPGENKTAQIAIEVEDTGIGISEQRQKAIFDPFEQAEDTTAQQYGGSGLGLTISQQLANLMDGKITVESNIGKGTIFRLQIPGKISRLTRLQETALMPSTTPNLVIHSPEQLQGTKGHLLLVEDHDVNQLLIKAMTDRLGYETTLAIDGADAFDKIENANASGTPFDLVLMDIQMPVMDGYQATRMIRTSGISSEELPIIAISANAYDDDIECCLASGMQAHIAKPVMIEKLQRILNQWVAPDPSGLTGFANPEPSALLTSELNRRYLRRKKEALRCLSDLLRASSFNDRELCEVADHLHKLAGTAAIFGDADLGDKAKLIETGLKEWKVNERQQNIRIAVQDLLQVA